MIIPSEEQDLHSPKCLAHSNSTGQIVVTQVGLDHRHEVSVFEYLSEDYHSLKSVPYLTHEARAKQHMMRKAKSLDSAPTPPPPPPRYFSSHVNGYVAPSITRKSASQRNRSSKTKQQVNRRSLQEEPTRAIMENIPTVIVNGEPEHEHEKPAEKTHEYDSDITKTKTENDNNKEKRATKEKDKKDIMGSVNKRAGKKKDNSDCDERKGKVSSVIGS